MAHFLKLPMHPVPSILVIVGNGAHISCSGVCLDTLVILEGHKFWVPFYVMDIEGAELVLGMEWLRALGRTTTDFSVPSMSFLKDDTTCTLVGQPMQPPTPTTFNHLKRMLDTDFVAELHTLTCCPLRNLSADVPTLLQLEGLTSKPTDLNLDIWSVLQKYAPVFTHPQGLPSQRPHDHHITLLPNSQPVKVQPYRYPHT